MDRDYVNDMEFIGGKVIGNHVIYGIGHNSKGDIVLLTDNDDILVSKKEDNNN